MKKSREFITAKRYIYSLGIFFLIIVVLVAFVMIRADRRYYNKRYQYFVKFPEGWLKDYERPKAISYRSPDMLPVSMESEAAVVIVMNDQLKGLSLENHFQIVNNDLLQEGRRILITNVTFIDNKKTKRIQFQDDDGLHTHIWYLLLDENDHFVVLQFRVSVWLIEKHLNTFQEMMESFKFKS